MCLHWAWVVAPWLGALWAVVAWARATQQREEMRGQLAGWMRAALEARRDHAAAMRGPRSVG